ncbi:cholinephosphotransferase 1 isoform X2 [Python bivittatus]|uniref:Cholinephosphotransferase 1 n=1 Tax=Python bivittatus TaxID=176946 RepID=A0A9F3QUD4_PYTBI|nr:cholinephosphotransferase 1 isoform X2 [Python bivittatus]
MALLEPLSAAQLKRLEEHRYSASGRSLLEPPLQRYWGWLVERTPLWLAPNAITLGGLVFNLVPLLVLMYYCPSATEEAPPWVFLFCALGLFIYQSMDAIDGKQARRTNSSSPLGELFDHGCDSISTVFIGIAACTAVRLGTDPDWLFFSSFFGMFLFYCAHWQTYVSGMLKFGKIDVTETEITVMIIFLLTSFGGTTMWDTKIPVLELQLKKILLAGVVCVAVYSTYNYFRVIFGGGVGKNGSTIAGTSVLSPGLHIGLIITLAIMIYKKSTTHLFEKHPCLYALTFGFVIAKITQKLMIAHMTKSEIFLQDTAFIGPGLLFLNQYFSCFIDEYIVLWIALFISLFDLLRYFTGICIQIAAHLHIQVQVISPLNHQNNMD